VLFLFATTFLLYAHLAVMLRQILPGKNKPGILISQAHFITAIVFSTSIAYGMELSIKPGTFNWAVPATMFFGLASAALFGAKLRTMLLKGQDGSALGWKSGAALWSCAAGLYLAYTAVDHWLFVAPAPDKIATVAMEFFKVKDVSCDRAAIVRTEGNEMVYRCPTSVMIGGWSAQPFIPWPAYVEGRSSLLKEAIDNMMSDAKRP